MKTLFQLFAALGTRFKTDAFLKARLKLTGLYVLIVAVILAAFSAFLYWQVEQQVETLKDLSTSDEVAISEADALQIVQELNQGTLVEIEEEVVGGMFMYAVELADENGAEVDLLINQQTGEVTSGAGAELWSDILINDFGENLLLANGIILLLVMVLSYFLAGWSLRPVQEKLRQHEQFSADVAHEMRTPLAAMLASVDAVLRTESGVDAYKESLTDVKSETKRLIALSEGLMQTLRTDGSKNEEQVDINDVVTGTVERLKTYAGEKGITCVVNGASKFSATGDRVLFERMFTNVLHNAIKFSHENGKIEIDVEGNTVKVIDHGVGMNEETKTKIFDRLFTADTARDERQAGGAGLGMAIVKEIADASNVEITIESKLGSGTCVQISFLQ